MTEIELLRDFPMPLADGRVEVRPKGSTHFVDYDTLKLLVGEGACAIVERKAHLAAPENKGAGQ